MAAPSTEAAKKAPEKTTQGLELGDLFLIESSNDLVQKFKELSEAKKASNNPQEKERLAWEILALTRQIGDSAIESLVQKANNELAQIKATKEPLEDSTKRFKESLEKFVKAAGALKGEMIQARKVADIEANKGIFAYLNQHKAIAGTNVDVKTGAKIAGTEKTVPTTGSAAPNNNVATAIPVPPPQPVEKAPISVETTNSQKSETKPSPAKKERKERTAEQKFEGNKKFFNDAKLEKEWKEIKGKTTGGALQDKMTDVWNTAVGEQSQNQEKSIKAVRDLQEYLNSNFKEKLNLDGELGKKTLEALKRVFDITPPSKK